MCKTCATVESYAVSGMSRGHRRAAITAGVSQLSGVRNVAVDLSADSVTITSSKPVPYDTLRVAIAEAGSTLTGELATAGTLGRDAL